MENRRRIGFHYSVTYGGDRFYTHFSVHMFALLVAFVFEMYRELRWAQLLGSSVTVKPPIRYNTTPVPYSIWRQKQKRGTTTPMMTGREELVSMVHGWVTVHR